LEIELKLDDWFEIDAKLKETDLKEFKELLRFEEREPPVLEY
jgi:hypothetical protein